MKTKLRNALEKAIDYLPLRQTIFPGDRVVIVPDAAVTRNRQLLAALLEYLLEMGLRPQDLMILLDAAQFLEEMQNPALRPLLPEEIRDEIVLYGFAPQQIDSCAILSLDEEGEPIALAHPLTDADVVLPIEQYHIDPPLGHYGPLTVLYPRFSDIPTQIRFLAQDAPENRKNILDQLAPKVQNAAQKLGVSMVIEAILDENDQVAELFFGDPNAVHKRLQKRKKVKKS